MPDVASPEKQAVKQMERGRRVEAEQASAKLARANDATPGTRSAEANSENQKLKAATADKTTGDSTESKLAKTPDAGVGLEGEFQIKDWSGYPEGVVPKPEGPFKLIEGQEYEEARKLANATNAKLRRQDPEYYKGLDIHEIHPVRWGGSPTELSNKIALPEEEHDRYTNWWKKKRAEVTQS